MTTAFELTKAAVPALLETGGGTVVNISSAAGRMADRGFAAYGTAKGALSHLTRIMAMDLSPHIRVNGIAVGSVATDALATVLQGDLRDQMEAATPLRRLGEPDDIAAAVLYLASPAGLVHDRQASRGRRWHRPSDPRNGHPRLRAELTADAAIRWLVYIAATRSW